jgi:hypothetical protein
VLARHRPHVWRGGDVRLVDGPTIREQCGPHQCAMPNCCGIVVATPIYRPAR